MKVYDKASLIWGVVFLCLLPLFALEVIDTDGWQWVFAIYGAVKCFRTALSKEENERQQHYKRVAKELFGPYAALKINSMLILLGVFLGMGILVRSVWDVILPAWTLVVALVLMTVAFFYSVGLDRQIYKEIDRQLQSESEK